MTGKMITKGRGKRETMKSHIHTGYGFFASPSQDGEKSDQNKSDFSGQLARKIVDYDEQHPDDEY